MLFFIGFFSDSVVCGIFFQSFMELFNLLLICGNSFLEIFIYVLFDVRGLFVSDFL